MDTQQSLVKKKQKVAKLESKIALLAKKQRKQDARNKIELGGLIIKAGLDKYSKSIILGILTAAAEEIQSDKKAKDIFKSKGENAFMGFDE